MSIQADPGAGRRKRKALLAGGTVLGVGAAVTLAAWTDDAWVNGTFAAGTFNVQGAVDAAGTDWQEYETRGGAGTLAFSVDATTMSPGDSVYAPLNLRIGPEVSEYDAAVTLPTAPTGPVTPSTSNDALFNALRLSLYNVAPGSCSDTGTATASPIVGFDEAPLSTTSTATLITLAGDMTAEGVCFKVTLPEGTGTEVSGGQTGALTWQLHAESVEP